MADIPAGKGPSTLNNNYMHARDLKTNKADMLKRSSVSLSQGNEVVAFWIPVLDPPKLQTSALSVQYISARNNIFLAHMNAVVNKV